MIPCSLRPTYLPSVALALGLASMAAPAAAQLDEARIARAAPAEWATYGRDYAETHYSPLSQITTTNVGQLREAWSWEIPKTGSRLEATPIMVDGVIYATGSYSYVFALDARTGRLIWQWDPGIPEEAQGGPSVCCGNVNRRVAVLGDKVYAGVLDGRLVALDRHTGLVKWAVQTTPRNSDYSITQAPHRGRQRDHWQLGRRVRRARLRDRLRRRDRRAALALVHGAGQPRRRLRERGDAAGGRDVDGRIRVALPDDAR